MTVLLASTAASGLVLAWGFWQALHHASLQLRVDDYSLRSERQAYGTAHDVTLALRDEANVPLAVARSVEPLGYILAVHQTPTSATASTVAVRRPATDDNSHGLPFSSASMTLMQPAVLLFEEMLQRGGAKSAA